MAKQSASEQVFCCIEREGGVKGKNPAERISRKTGIPAPQVLDEIRKLEDDGSVAVVRDGGQLRDVRPQRRVRAHRDRTEWSAQAKREQSFAKFVPGTLRDDQCGPVVISYLPGYGPGGEACDVQTGEEMVIGPQTGDRYYDRERPFHENATDCLRTLQIMADDRGVGEGLSVEKTLLELVSGLGKKQCAKIMVHLRKLGLYETRKVGFGTSTYTVRLDITEVTDEMIQEARQLMATSSQSGSGAATKKSGSSDPSASETDEAAQGPTVEEVITRLTEIITSLEHEVRELREQCSYKDRRIHDLEDAARRQAIVDPRALQIMERFSQS